MQVRLETQPAVGVHLRVAGNVVRQLLVHECDLKVLDVDTGLQVASEYGQWQALRGADASDDPPLTARLPAAITSRTRVA